MLALPTIQEMNITKDDVTNQSFGFGKLEIYEAALNVISYRIATLADAALLECVDDREAIYGDFEWNAETEKDVYIAFPDLPVEFVKEFIFGTQIWHEHERSQVASVIGHELLKKFTAQPGGEGRFLAAFGFVQTDYPDGAPSVQAAPPPPPPAPVQTSAPNPAFTIPPANRQIPIDPPPVAALVEAYEMLGKAINFAPKVYAHQLGISPGTLGNYFNLRTAPKVATPAQMKFILADIDIRMGQLTRAAELISGVA